MANICLLDGDRSAFRTASQTCRKRYRCEYAEHGRPVAKEVREVAGAQGIVPDVIGQHDHRTTTEERGQVHAIREIEPFRVTQSVRPPSSAKIRERCHVWPRYCHNGPMCRARSTRFAAHTWGMDESMQSLTAVLAIVAGFGAVALLVARLVTPVAPAVGAFGARVVAFRAPLTLLVAAVATLGSLYFSEVAHYVPCRLCWFQRVAMYPIAVIALVGLIRRDRGARWYFLPLAVIGLVISSYHYLIEWKPSLDTGSCALFGPACTDIWFRSFGFVTLAFMALCGFAFIIVVNTLTFPAATATHPSTPPPSTPPPI